MRVVDINGGAMLINIMLKEYFGAAERINIYSIIIYTGILSLWMKKYIKNNGVRTGGGVTNIEKKEFYK